MFEKVNPLHPDKVADRIAGALVDYAYTQEENPKIAVCVYLENSGAGGTWAAPVASLVVEKYLRGEVKRTELEQMVAATNLKQFVPVKSKKR